MQTFKAKIEKNTEYKVTAEDFKIACKVNRELVQDKSFYGICPHCDGPVQLIGLYKKKETETRHSVSMFKAIIEYWNEIIFIIRQEYGIYISEEREKEILNTIKLSEVWLYPCADIRNLPWVILNRMPPEELYFKWIRKDSELYNVLVNKGIKLEKKNNNYYQIIKQDFYFNWNYRYDGFAQKAVDDEIVDSIEECIIEETKDDTGYIEHYASTKVINRNRFYNLIHSEKALSNPRRKEKQELAAEILGEPPIPNE